jgi:hypothetical protein
MAVSPHLWIYCLAYQASQKYKRWGETDCENLIYHLPSGQHYAASDIACWQCRFHLIFGYVVWCIKRHRSSKDDVKSTARTRYITCRLDGITRQVIFHVHNVGRTSSLDMLLSISSITEVLKMTWNRQRELNISLAEWTALHGKWYFMLTMSVLPHLWICCLS